MIKDKKATAFLAHAMKVAVRKQNELNHMKKLQNKAKAKAAAPKCGRCSDLPTDHNWEQIAIDARTMRFYDDKRCKGANRKIEAVMVTARAAKRWF